MGNIRSSLRATSSTSVASTSVSRTIDKKIKADQKRMKKEVKLLLLGAGESGKSTVLKQMRLIHASGFKSSEREGFRIVVFFNIFTTMQTILEALDSFNLQLTDPVLIEYASLFIDTPSLEENQPFPEIYLEPLKSLWHCDIIHKAHALWDPSYTPSDQDIIRCRAKTTGIVETIFHLGPLTYRMFDVGGQRSERKKWIHCFDNVTSILFVVAISGYDQCLAEDRDSNQMHEALMLFDTTCNSHWFEKTSMILLLNKIDIFKKKIVYSPIQDYFPDYKGHVESYDAAKEYFKRRFQRLNHKPDKRVYVHFTDATDTNLLQHVMMAVSDIILNENLSSIMM
ncbi:hypothetical protein HPULCUR_007072 [Helicostylum pulchrum]|uniref:Uncharacterized protein n=1 Tax=Helicostylum pulchrum TaxID=562976 RepID=A0ABP9Y3Q9_9FUNG